jgi:hypothetical protein
MAKLKPFLFSILRGMGRVVDIYGFLSLLVMFASYLMKTIELVGPSAWVMLFTLFAIGLVDVLQAKLGAMFHWVFIFGAALIFTMMSFQPFSSTLISDIFVTTVWSLIFTILPRKRGANSPL